MNTSAVGTRPYLWGLEPASPENLRMSDPLRCNSKHSETFLPTLYMIDLYISMIYLYISIICFDINSKFSIICVVLDLILHYFEILKLSSLP